jgi:DNA-binding CsgD family transcriptional regulator
MPKSNRLSVSDVRSLVQLVGECRDLGDDPYAWRSHWLLKMGQLIGADLLTGGEIAAEPDGSLRGVGVAAWGWENGFDKSVWAAGMAAFSDLRFSPVFRAYLAHDAPHADACLSRKELVNYQAWEASAYYQQLHRPVGIEHTLICFIPSINTANEFSGVAASREKGARRDFSGRDCVLVREINLALAALIGGPLARFDAPSATDLAPRVRQELACLLEGDGDKQIAARLGISRFTVNQYTKIIFRHFGVQSRSLLMARWIRRARPRD